LEKARSPRSGDPPFVCGADNGASTLDQHAADEYRTDKTANRQVLGSMNDFAWLLEAYLDHGDALLEASLRLADAPCSPLKMDRPKDITREVFGVSASRLRLVTKR
jgi:hypothetical protein